MSAQHHAAIGIFDSGVGGLSVLQHIRTGLPAERLLYVADAGFAPYGDKPESFVIARSLAIAAFLIERDIKALVVACNTATARAIAALREHYPALIIIGIEPGLKPAAQHSQAKRVGVMATQGTLQSQKFQHLRDQISAETGVQFFSEACIGLATQIEKAELYSAETADLVRRYLHPLLNQGIDTLVLGCTHYPFVTPVIQGLIAAEKGNAHAVQLVDTGEAVARQLKRLLAQHSLQISAPADLQSASPRSVLTSESASESASESESESESASTSAPMQAWTTGSTTALRLAFERLLKMSDKDVTIDAIIDSTSSDISE